LSDTGTVKFLLGKQPTTSGWIKAELKESNLLSENFKLTKKGRQTQLFLKELIKEVS